MSTHQCVSRLRSIGYLLVTEPFFLSLCRSVIYTSDSSRRSLRMRYKRKECCILTDFKLRISLFRIIFSYTPPAMGKRVRHFQLMTQSIASSLESYQVLSSTYFRYTCADGKYHLTHTAFSSLRLPTQGKTSWFVA
jgi:hypothetical protein